MFIVSRTDPDIELDELIFHKPNSTTLCRSDFLLLIRINNENTLDPGVGGRFTFNLTDYLSLEAEMNFFPKKDSFEGGRKLQGLFGAKVGAHKERIGIFAKVRPGFVHFNDFLVVEDLVRTPTTIIGIAVGSSHTFFALDAGGVLEFYPSRHTAIRFDLGDTVIHYRSLTPSELNPAFTRHNLQFSAGFGFRF